MKEDYLTLLQRIFQENSLINAVISLPKHRHQELQKTTVRPLLIKGVLHYQITQYRQNKAFHQNITPQECLKFIQSLLESDFNQALLGTKENDYQILISKKGRITIVKSRSTRPIPALTHNRQKQYLLEENTQVPFLVELGIMTETGKIVAKKNHKFKQLNRFLEMVDDILPHLEKNKTLRIVDFGCGKAYLTFALYHYFVCMKGYSLEVHGLDLKDDVIAFCQTLAEKLQYTGLQFTVGDIKDYHPQEKVDFVIALHACDTATDIAIAKAIEWDADVIMCVPCCQKELNKQIHNQSLTPILKHGILKERFAAIATDAARAQLLEISGYNTQVLEFIDLEHTPKNLLIRAVKQRKKSPEKALDEYREFTKTLEITPYLEKIVKIEG